MLQNKWRFFSQRNTSYYALEVFRKCCKFKKYIYIFSGEEGEKNISENGDCKLDSLPFSERLKEAKKILTKIKKNEERKKRVEQRQKHKGEKE